MFPIPDSFQAHLDIPWTEAAEWPTADDTYDSDADCHPDTLALQRTLPLAEALSASPWLQRIHTHAPQQDALPRLYVIESSLLAGLISSKNGHDSVWYIRIPPTEHSALRALFRESQVSLVPAERDSPWGMSWVTISVADDHPEPQGCLMLSIEPHERVWQDATLGLYIVYECDGTVYQMGRTEMFIAPPCTNEDDINPVVDAERLITKVFRKLQARTRDWEAERRANGEAEYLRTLSVPAFKASSESDLEILGIAPLPGTAASDFYRRSGVPAGLGRLSVLLDTVPPGLESDDRKWVCLNVAPTLFAELAKGGGSLGVVRLDSSIAFERSREGGFYVIYVQVGLLAAATELWSADGPFADALSAWARAGECPLVVQNKHNGATLVFTLPWLTEVAPIVPGQISVVGRPNRFRQAGYALCQYLAQVSDGPPLLYLYQSDMLDERAWQEMIRRADDVWTRSERGRVLG